mmetsp:Transcript_65489/g.171565  ORF Transcript_65489/g.171565 Transcript_65489/m.171565 type:complete len:332 (+) Transcript_65489:690-1685(+)
MCCRHLRTTSRSNGADRPKSWLICAFDISRSWAVPVSLMLWSFSSTFSPTPMHLMMQATSPLPQSIGQAMTGVCFDSTFASGVSARRTAPCGEGTASSRTSRSRHARDFGGEMIPALLIRTEGVLPTRGVGAPTGPERSLAMDLISQVSSDINWAGSRSILSLGGEGVGPADTGAESATTISLLLESSSRHRTLLSGVARATASFCGVASLASRFCITLAPRSRSTGLAGSGTGAGSSFSNMRSDRPVRAAEAEVVPKWKVWLLCSSNTLLLSALLARRKPRSSSSEWFRMASTSGVQVSSCSTEHPARPVTRSMIFSPQPDGKPLLKCPQ